jgi:hypothetical protein
MSDTQFISEAESVIAAAERHRARIEAVAQEDIVYVYADPHTVVKTVVNAEPRYMAFRPRMAALGGELDLTLVDDCASFGRAYIYLGSQLAEEPEPGDPAALYAEALKKRELFATVRSSLGKAQVTSNTPHIRPFAGSAGRDEVSGDLFKHVAFFMKEWPNLEGKVPITKADVARGEVLAQALLYDPRKKSAALGTGSPQLVMYQAGTLLVRAYAEVRRAIVFLRGRQGDADEIAPPLYSGRTPPKKGEKVSPDEAQPAQPQSEPVAQAAPPAAAVPGGLKGSTPFTV